MSDIREKIARYLVDLEEHLPNEVSFWDTRASDTWKKIHLTVADGVLKFFPEWAKENGYVKLAEDQRLPENPRPRKNVWGNTRGEGYFRCQQDMLKAGFRKVKD